MNGIVKLALVVGIIYFAYTYYYENISKVGKEIKRKKESSNAIEVSALAKKLELEQNSLNEAKCNSRYSAGIYEWTDVARCKQEKKIELSMQDWEALARAKLGI